MFPNRVFSRVFLVSILVGVASQGFALDVKKVQSKAQSVQNAELNVMQPKTVETTQQVVSQPNAGLNQVSPNSDFILEVPVEFNGSGTFGSEYGSLEGKSYNQIAVYCEMHFYDKDWETPDTVKITKTKVITLGPDSSYNGPVRFGIEYSGIVKEELDRPGITIDAGVTGPSRCDLKLIAPDGRRVAVEEKGPNYNSSVDLGTALYNHL